LSRLAAISVLAVAATLLDRGIAGARLGNTKANGRVFRVTVAFVID
jgi:hypothetical protein